MSARYRTVAVTTLLAITGVAAWEATVIRRQREKLDVLTKSRDQLALEISSLRKSRAATDRELAEAEGQLAKLATAAGTDSNISQQRQLEMNAWLARVKRLRRLFHDQPAQRIPELQLLTDADWLRLAKTAQFDSELEIRQGMAQARTVATRLFADRVRVALAKFVRANGTSVPQTIFSIAPYFDPPIDPAILTRYEIAPSSPSGIHGPALWQLQNKSPIDAEYDERFVVTSGGWESSSGPMAWITNFRERYDRAVKAFGDANNGTKPTKVTAVLPFFDPPIDPETTDRLIKADRQRPLRPPLPMPR